MVLRSWNRRIHHLSFSAPKWPSLHSETLRYKGQNVKFWELRNIYHHHPESKKRKSSEKNSGFIHPYGRYGNAVTTRKTISTIAILWPVKAIFEKRAGTVEVDSFLSPEISMHKNVRLGAKTPNGQMVPYSCMYTLPLVLGKKKCAPTLRHPSLGLPSDPRGQRAKRPWCMRSPWEN